MFWAVVAPEVVVAWAIRQWFAAGEIADIYNKHKGQFVVLRVDVTVLLTCIRSITFGNRVLGLPLACYKTLDSWAEYGDNQRCFLYLRLCIHAHMISAWTKTHGHFLCMGGFVAVQVEGANHDPTSEDATVNGEVISFESFKRLIKDGNFDVSITEREIEDKSKRDSLSKAIAILQTSRFIANCIARWRQKLALTELELVTLALASLNAITYTFWWAKPYDVKVPVKIYVKANLHSLNETGAQLPVSWELLFIHNSLTSLTPTQKRRATGGSIDENEVSSLLNRQLRPLEQLYAS